MLSKKNLSFTVDCQSLTIADLHTVNVELVDIVHLWEKFGHTLGIRQAILDKIAANFRDVDRRFTEVLASWFSGEGTSSAPSWGDVATALNSPVLNMQQHAEELIQKIKAGK